MAYMRDIDITFVLVGLLIVGALVFLVLALVNYIKIKTHKDTGKSVKDKSLTLKYKIVCIASKSENCVIGELETIVPLEVGHQHNIKGVLWECYKVGKNISGQDVADFEIA